jgi:hypothetical protein
VSHNGPLRRSALALTLSLSLALASAAALAATASPASAQSPTWPGDEQGLFGESDPTADGVWRQSLALLGLNAAGLDPADATIGWLQGQQCGDGSFLSYRADIGQPCTDVTAADTNATALAVQALAGLGEAPGAVDKALTWLRDVQNEDGGWSFSPGGASDANSTAVVIGAFAAAGEDPAEVTRDGASPYDALTALQLDCEVAEEEQRGAFAWQPDAETGELFANDAATVDAVLAAYGSGLLVDPDQAAATEPVTPPSCDGTDEEATDTDSGTDADAAAQAGAAGAAYLAGVLEENDQHVVMLTQDGEEQADYGSTADAVLALVAAGDAEAAQGPLGWLEENHTSWTGYADSPAVLGTLVLAAHAGGASPEDFGGTDLVAALNLLSPADEAEAGDGEGEESADDDGAGPLLWLLAAGAVLLVAIVLLVVRRRSRTEERQEHQEGEESEESAE